MKDILIWSDYACPYCYIGEKRLMDAIDQLHLREEFNILYKAFELNPDAPRKTDETIPELLAKKYHMTLEQAKERVAEIDRAGNESGLVFRYGTAPSSNTLDAHRLMKFAEEKYGMEVAETLNRLLFEAYFTDNRRLADHDVLMQLAVNAGMPTEETSRVLNSERYIKQVRQDEDEAHRLNVRGVPFIVFDRRIAVPGAISVDDFKKVLEDVIKDAPEEERLAGNTCTESGCSI